MPSLFSQKLILKDFDQKKKVKILYMNGPFDIKEIDEDYKRRPATLYETTIFHSQIVATLLSCPGHIFSPLGKVKKR